MELALTGCFCLRLLWQEDHVLISICCTSTIHLHAHPKESIPHTALTDPTLVGKRLHSRFRLTGLTALTLSDGAGHDLFVRFRKVGAGTRVSEHTVPLKYHCQEGTRCFLFPFEVSLCSLKQTSSSTIGSSKRRRRCFTIKCLISGRKAQATKDVWAACLAHWHRHNLGET